ATPDARPASSRDPSEGEMCERGGSWAAAGAGSADPFPATAYGATRHEGITHPNHRRLPRGRRTPPPPPPTNRHRSARLLVRDVSRDDLVHRLAGVPDTLFAQGEIDERGVLRRSDALDFLARHVPHEPRRHPVEPGDGVL